MARGVVIRDDAPFCNDAGEEEYDASKIDYNALFGEVITIAPELRSFIDFVKNIQPPQWREWVALLPQAKNGNKWAYNRIFEMYLRVVIKTAFYFYEHFRVSISDAIQDGSRGLMYAIEQYDPAEHITFPGYINWPILTHIQRWANFSPLPFVYIPAHVQTNLFEIFDLVENHFCTSCFCKEKYDCEILITLVSQKINCHFEKAKFYLSLFKRYDNDIESIPDDCVEDKTNGLAMIENQNIIHLILKELPRKEEQVLRMRFGFENKRPMNLHEIGITLGLTRERVRQIELKAINKLKHPARLNKLLNLL